MAKMEAPLPSAVPEPGEATLVSKEENEVPSKLSICTGQSDESPYHEVDGRGRPIFPRAVGVGIKVESILKIDTVACNFTAKLKASFEWQLTKSEHEMWLQDHWQSKKGRPPWEPLIEFPAMQKVEVKQELTVPYADHNNVFDVFEHEGKFYVIFYIRYRGVFAEQFELNNFPYDCQDLAIEMESTDSTKGVLCPRFKRKDFASFDIYNFNLLEWELHAPVISFPAPSEDSTSRAGLKRSTLIVQLKVKRNSHYYVSRIAYLARALTLTSLLSWSIDINLPHRLLLCFTILLVLVAFQTALGNKLPQVGYYTLMDHYLVSCQRFIMLVAIEHAVLTKFFRDHDSVATIDHACFGVTTALWLVIQVFAFFLGRHRAKLEEQKLSLNPVELEDWMAANGQRHKVGRHALTRSFTFSSELMESQGDMQFCSSTPKNAPTSTRSFTSTGSLASRGKKGSYLAED